MLLSFAHKEAQPQIIMPAALLHFTAQSIASECVQMTALGCYQTLSVNDNITVPLCWSSKPSLRLLYLQSDAVSQIQILFLIRIIIKSNHIRE